MKKTYNHTPVMKENNLPFIADEAGSSAKKWFNTFTLMLLLLHINVAAQVGQLEGYSGSRNTNNGPSNIGSDTAAVLGYNAGSSATFSASAISYSILFPINNILLALLLCYQPGELIILGEQLPARSRIGFRREV